ncbi:MAG: zinc-ribbon domain-containing protein [Bacillota bacterium]|nr:zinc-ribbon domain-containing protein [Bacillota bacterium]
MEEKEYCSEYGAENNANGDYKTCSNCGARVKAIAKFCNKCGSPM